MKRRIMLVLCSVCTTVAMFVTAPSSLTQQTATTTTVPVRIAVTANVASDKRMPQINPEDVVVKQGKQRLQVTEWVPAQGERAGLDLFILIDDASSSRLGSNLDELRTFINAQPPTTSVGVGYMRNAGVQIAQNLTHDHAAAAKALRLPFGSTGAYGSPYLSVIDLMTRWPESQNRHEVVMVTDGIDRARGGPRWRGLSNNPDIDSASAVAIIPAKKSSAATWRRPRRLTATILAPKVTADRHDHSYDLRPWFGPPAPQLLGSHEWADGHRQAIGRNWRRVLLPWSAERGELQTLPGRSPESTRQPVLVELFCQTGYEGRLAICDAQHRSCRCGVLCTRRGLGTCCEIGVRPAAIRGPGTPHLNLDDEHLIPTTHDFEAGELNVCLGG